MGDAELDKMMQQLLGPLLGGGGEGQQPGEMPDIKQFAQMFGQLATAQPPGTGDGSGQGMKPDENKIKEAEKLLEECMGTIKQEAANLKPGEPQPTPAPTQAS